MGFPDGLLCSLGFIRKFWVFYLERGKAPEGPLGPTRLQRVSKLHSGQFSFSNPKLRGIVRSTEGDSSTFYTYQVDAFLNNFKYSKEQRPFINQPEAVRALSAYEGFT